MNSKLVGIIMGKTTRYVYFIATVSCLFTSATYGMKRSGASLTNEEPPNKHSKLTTTSTFTSQQPEVTLISSDGKKFLIPKDTAEHSFILKNILNSSIEKTKEIHLREIDSITLAAIVWLITDIKQVDPYFTFDYAKHNLPPYTARQIQPIVNKILAELDLEHQKQFILAVNFLDIKFHGMPLLPTLSKTVAAHVVDNTMAGQQITDVDRFTDKSVQLIGPMGDIPVAELIKQQATLAAKGIKEFTVADYLNDHIHTHGKHPEITTNGQGLRTLVLSNKKLTSLEGLQLIKSIDTVRLLDLGNNKLTTIQPDAFIGLTNLQILWLGGNQLTTIQPGAFNGLTNLQILGLNHNQLQTIQPNAFNGLGNLQDLYLDKNQLTTIQPNAFNGLGSLQYLGLNHNQLQTIQPGAFNGLNSLQTLSLSFNQLKTIKSGAFNALGNLQRLSLSFNQLKTIQPRAFNGLGSLLTLDLNNNQLTSAILNQIQQALPNTSITR